MRYPFLLLLFTLFLFAGCATPPAESFPKPPKPTMTAGDRDIITRGNAILEGLRTRDYRRFLVPLPASQRKQFTRDKFDRMLTDLAARNGSLINHAYLIRLEQPLRFEYYWIALFEKIIDLPDGKTITQTSEFLFKIDCFRIDDQPPEIATLSFSN